MRTWDLTIWTIGGEKAQIRRVWRSNSTRTGLMSCGKSSKRKKGHITKSRRRLEKQIWPVKKNFLKSWEKSLRKSSGPRLGLLPELRAAGIISALFRQKARKKWRMTFRLF